MAMTITIDVTQSHIDKGIKGNCHSCPIALAVNSNEQVKNMNYICSQVRWGSIALFNLKTRLTYYIPISAIVGSFIEAFDIGVPVSPFTFDMWINE